jgi:hypothetical protein
MDEYERVEREDQLGKPMTFRAPPALARRIEAEAGRELISVSAFVRRAVLQSLSLTPPEGL